MVDAREIDRRAKAAGQEAREKLETRNIRVAIRDSGLEELFKEEGLLVRGFHFASPRIGCNESDSVQAHFDIMKPDSIGGTGILGIIEPDGEIDFVAGAGILPWSHKRVSERDWRG